MAQGKDWTKEEMKCAICGFDRLVDRCHIIPKRLLYGLKDYSQYASFDKDNKNIVLLCRNHHALFDLFRLNKQEMEILEPHIESMKMDILNLLNSDLKTYKKYQERKDFVKVSRDFSSWQERASNMFVNLNYFIKNN